MSTTYAAPTSTNARHPEAVVPGFSASPRLTEHLQAVLVDLIELHVQGKQAHWNVVGPNFRDLHLALDEVVDAAREFSDTVAERMRALRADPDGRTDTVAATTRLPQFPSGAQQTGEVVELVRNRLHAVVAGIRAVHDEVDDEDPTSADLLHQIIESLEKHAWLIGAENGA
jgi:starvation-inducible DNA-binding protein